MNRRIFLSIALIPLVAISVGLACSIGSQTETPEHDDTSGQENPTSLEKGQISDIDELDDAVVLIDTEGSYIDPFEGWQVNAGSWGTGFIIDPEGIAVTNNHVVTGAAKLNVWVKGEETPRKARVLGVSECYDLAVIDIDGEGFSYVDWYKDEIKAGVEVFSAGFPSTASQVDYTLTEGIVSKPNTSLFSDWASVDNVIAHTAKIIGGNSGGPLVDGSANVIGVNYANVDITDENYAVSREVAVPIIEKLKAGNDVESIGINGTAVSGDLFGSDITGLWVRSVKSGTPADVARIQAGDIILDFENQVLNQDVMKDYCDVLRSHVPEDTLAITVVRSATGEIFTGQLNGRELEYVYTMEIVEQATEDISQDADVDIPSDSDDGALLDDGGEEIPENVFNEGASAPGDIYYYENFNPGVSESPWIYTITKGSESGFSQDLDLDGYLQATLTEEDMFVYYTFLNWEFDDVWVDTQVENLGEDSYNAGLFCRGSNNNWYEALIRGNGEYFIYYYDANASQDNYQVLESGNSEEIYPGKDTNVITLACVSSELYFEVNGVHLATVDLNSFDHEVLESGNVGLTLESESETPVEVNFHDFVIGVP